MNLGSVLKNKEKIFAFKKVMNNKDDEKKQISVLFEWN